MYKKQMTIQKILCLAAVIVSAIVFLYALGIMTDLYDALYDTMRNPNNVYSTDVEGSIIICRNSTECFSCTASA